MKLSTKANIIGIIAIVLLVAFFVAFNTGHAAAANIFWLFALAMLVAFFITKTNSYVSHYHRKA